MLLFFDIASMFNSVFWKSCLMQCFRSHLDIKQPEQWFHSELVKIHEEGNEQLCKLGNTLIEKETGFLEEMLDSRAVPTPKPLIKDHKPMNEKGELLTRLICPSNKFDSGVPKARIPGYQNHF
jgi:hypothetical protein